MSNGTNAAARSDNEKGGHMSRTSRVLAFMVPGFLLATMPVTVSSQGPARILPIKAYLDVTDIILFQWFDPVSGNRLIIDLFGFVGSVLNLDLGTVVDGQVVVRPLRNGQQRVTVDLHTKNAICYGRNAARALAFGVSFGEIEAGQPPTLGNVMMQLEFTQAAGPIDPSAPFDSLVTTVMCDGVLRSGSGYPDGTPGFAQTVQVGLFTTGVPGGCPPEKDASCFPAEKVQFKPTGR